jgi:pimeloyl-ACP methyl ester carboxylesterase
LALNPQLNFVAVDGGAVPLVDQGRGPAILLLHGWTLDSRVWRPQLIGLAERFRVLAIDRRGFGQSTAPADLSQESDDIFAVLDAADVDRCVLVGQSQAGQVALRFALNHPDRLTGVALQGASLGGVEPGPDPNEAIPLARYADWVAEGRLDLVKGEWRSHPLMALPGPDRAAAEPLLADIEADYDGRDLLAPPPSQAAITPADLASLTVPLLALTGALETPWRRRVADAAAACAPQSSRVRIPAAGHLCNLDAVSAFNAALAQFADGVAG